MPSSQETYLTGWKSWLQYTKDLHVDPFLRTCPADFPSTSSMFDFPTICLINFMFVRFHIQKLSAATILTYCAGIKFHFKCANVDTSFFQAFVAVMARAALALMCRQRIAKSEASRLPFTLDLILRYRRSSGLLTYKQRCVYTAMRLAFLLLLRVSEYTITKANHFLRAEDITFVLPTGYVSSFDLSSAQALQVIGVLITIRSAKNDKYKEGHRFFFPRVDPGPNDGCICSLLLQWALEARLRPGQQFFSYRSMWRMSGTDVSDALQGIARTVHLDPARFTPHSLRYGGASALAAANVPTYLIQQLGRWKSLAFLQYIKLSEQLLSLAQIHLSDPHLLTVDAIIRAHPGAVITRH